MDLKYKLHKVLAIVIIICTLLPLFQVSAATKADTARTKTGEYILNAVSSPKVGSIGGEWAIIGLARSDMTVASTYYDKYYTEVTNYVAANINDSEQLNKNKSTDNSRVIIALTAIGKNPASVAGHNLLMGITDLNYLKKQGINGPVWALIAFDSGNYTIPTNSKAAVQTTREKLIDYILEMQTKDGGWTVSGSVADPDMTSMAIQSLAPYYNSNARVKTAVDRAITKLSDLQLDSGAYRSWGSVSAESCAQVMVALCALGIDPSSDSRFVKNGNSVLDGLMTFYVEGGGFCQNDKNSQIVQMSTEQSYYALVAFYRYSSGKNSLYNMIAEASAITRKKGETVTCKKLRYKITAVAKIKEDGSISEGKVTLLSSTKKISKLVIPASIKIDGMTYKVTAVASNAFYGDKTLTSVTIGKNITKIGKGAFKNCPNLKTVIYKNTK